MTVYVETSAIAKLLVPEPESAALSDSLNALAAQKISLVTSTLTETELRRLAVRRELNQAAVSGVLDRFDLVDLERSTLTEAGLLPGTQLRSLDALHLAAAIRTEAECVIAYDIRLTESARSIGLRVVAPA